MHYNDATPLVIYYGLCVQEMLTKAQQKENELNAELRQCQDELEAAKVLCCTVYYKMLLCVWQIKLRR